MWLSRISNILQILESREISISRGMFIMARRQKHVGLVEHHSGLRRTPQKDVIPGSRNIHGPTHRWAQDIEDIVSVLVHEGIHD